MPFGNGIGNGNGIGLTESELVESNTTVFDCATDGTFDVSTSTTNPNTTNSTTKANSTNSTNSRTRARSTMKQPKKLSLQEEMLLASTSATEASEAVKSTKAVDSTLEPTKNVGITELS